MGRDTPSYSSAAVQRYNAERAYQDPQDGQNGAVSVMCGVFFRFADVFSTVVTSPTPARALGHIATH